MNFQDKIIVFTDGSSSGNPGPGGWGTLIAYPAGSRGIEVVELGGGEKRTTNNRMELMAAIGALEEIKKTDDKIVIYSDSAYVINGITKWVFGWQAKGWMTLNKQEVLNRDLWERLAGLCKGKKIDWSKIDGHCGVAGNERVDEIATTFTNGKVPSLYRGLQKNYSVKFNDLSKCEIKTENKSRSSAKAYSYLSLLKGELQIHKTWDECKARVEGKSGAKYRKSISPENEKEIMKEWGIN
ncbi:MAG: ribonuclease HI [Minisyncoccia bacterium]